MMETWLQWGTMIVGLLSSGGILYLLIDRFARTPQQKGADSADMVAKISDAFDKTLQTVMHYSQEVIEKMKQDDERAEQRYRENDERAEHRYRELETRYDRLEQRFNEKEADRELLKTIVGKAVDCKYLKAGHNNDCPVLRENQKRLAAKCKACADNRGNEKPKNN